MTDKHKLECPKCKKRVWYTMKMYHTKVCNECQTIISSDISADKVMNNG